MDRQLLEHKIKKYENTILTEENIRDLEVLLLCVGDELEEIEINEKNEILQALCKKYNSKKLYEIQRRLKWDYKRDYARVLSILEDVPINENLLDNFTRLKITLIDKKYVHKLNENNILLSHPVQIGNVYYYKGFNKTSEFNIDHPSDHLEGIVLFESLRQMGIASAHFCGIPFDGVVVIIESDIEYLNFVELSRNYLIQCLPAIKRTGGLGFVAFRVLQDDTICAKGYFRAIVYKNKEMYEKYRKL